MAGVLHFGHQLTSHKGFSGLFWQISWETWQKIAPKSILRMGKVHINVAEFLAALVTCETFSDFVEGSITTLELDNVAAKAWIDSARCTRHPYDRCAQGSHLYMLKHSMKIRTRWVPSEENVLADECSRKAYSRSRLGHIISGARLRRVSPRWLNVLRFCK